MQQFLKIYDTGKLFWFHYSCLSNYTGIFFFICFHYVLKPPPKKEKWTDSSRESKAMKNILLLSFEFESEFECLNKQHNRYKHCYFSGKIVNWNLPIFCVMSLQLNWSEVWIFMSLIPLRFWDLKDFILLWDIWHHRSFKLKIFLQRLFQPRERS